MFRWPRLTAFSWPCGSDCDFNQQQQRLPNLMPSLKQAKPGIVCLPEQSGLFSGAFARTKSWRVGGDQRLASTPVTVSRHRLLWLRTRRSEGRSHFF